MSHTYMHNRAGIHRLARETWHRIRSAIGIRLNCAAPTALLSVSSLPTALPWATLWSRLTALGPSADHQPLHLPKLGCRGSTFLWHVTHRARGGLTNPLVAFACRLGSSGTITCR